jgi:hypothetical protein
MPTNAPLTPDAPMQVPIASLDYQGQKGDAFGVGLGVNVNPSNNLVANRATSVVVATQANVDLSSALANGQTVDGVTLATDQLVLVKAQTLPAQNGVYVVPASGAASRSTAFGAYGLSYHRNAIRVVGGTSAGKNYLQATRGALVVGTSLITFELYAGQLENQASILDATAGSMTRQGVQPLNSRVHERVYEGIRTCDNQSLEGFYPVGNVRVATTAGITLSGIQTVDGVALAAGDRVLVKNGATASAPYTAVTAATTENISSLSASPVVIDGVTLVETNRLLVKDQTLTKNNGVYTVGTVAAVQYTDVDAATTENISDLANASVVIDGVTLVATNRVLVKDQAATKYNGIYVVGTVTEGVAALTRATDMDTAGECVLGKGVPVAAGGTVNGGSMFAVSAVPTTLGTDPLTFVLSSVALVSRAPLTRSTDMDVVGEVLLGKGVPVTAGGTVNGGKTFLVSAVPTTLGTDPLTFQESSTATVDDEFNGVYVAASGAWARSTDADASAEVRYGMTAFVREGSVNGKNSFYLKTANPITLGVTALSFENLEKVITENFKNKPVDTIRNVAEAGVYRSA